MQPFIQARGLVKRFGDFTAVDGIDLLVHPGECFGLLGPNGAGKTSTIRMITCVSPPTAGSLAVEGLDAGQHGRAIRARIGVVPQNDNLDPDLNVEENLLAYGRYFRLPAAVIRERIAENLALVQLEDRARSRIDELSGGMKRRLIIARALLNAPGMLVLDEPTTGLDPQSRHIVWQRLRLLKARGITLLLTTHYMEEAAMLCDRIVIMDGGRIVTEGDPASLIAEHAGTEVLEVRVDPGERDALATRLSRVGGVEIEAAGDTLHVFGRDGGGTAALLSEIDGRHPVLRRPPNLEDVFLRLTGRVLTE